MIKGLIARLSGRSSKWPALKDDAIKSQPFCSACMRTRRLEVHHIKPVHLFKAEELNPDNLIVLCRMCHIFLGHFGDFKQFNLNVRWDARYWRARIKKGLGR